METSQSVIIWWRLLSFIAAFNICLLIYSYLKLKGKLPMVSDQLKRIRNWQFLLAAIYTLGCGFRSILPRGDIRRIVLYDHWISSVAIGRSVATIAELSFVAQWCFILYEAGIHTGNKTLLKIAKWPFFLIVVAEMFSWYACTTTNYIGSVVEESLWAVAAAVTLYGFVIARKYYTKAQRHFFSAGIMASALYVVYMVTVDVPNYVRGWLAGKANGKVYSTLVEGFREVATEWRLTRSYVDWQYEFVWMTLYFSLAVWISIYIVNGPFLDRNLRK